MAFLEGFAGKGRLGGLWGWFTEPAAEWREGLDVFGVGQKS
jgi:hypothetical protein